MTTTADSNVTMEREAAILAPYAMHSSESQGRRYPESPHPYRGPYQRDRDRILHCAAFRRLSQKTQVFTGKGDYHRTRLTHTLEVSSIARTIARALRLNEDLVEALALAHDLGHPPFGHSGEDVLNECLKDHGGFNHNAQGLRICELLETSYREFPGLNLTREVLDGQQTRAGKHRTAATSNDQSAPVLSPLLEVQVVDAADSIAYDAHDADDALELGLLTADELLSVPMWRGARERVEARTPNLTDSRRRRAIVHEVIDWQVSDVIETAVRILEERAIESVSAVRLSPPIIQSSPAVAEKKANLERFLFDKVYRHPRVLAERIPAQRSLKEMFEVLLNEPKKLPLKFQRLAKSEGVPRATVDYLAGMTDRFAMEEHQRLTAG